MAIPDLTKPAAGRIGNWVIAAVVALVLLTWAMDRIVDWLWMGQLGYRQVFWRILEVQLALFAAAFAVAMVYLELNMRAAMRLTAAWSAGTRQQPDSPLQALETHPLLRHGIPALVAFVVGMALAGRWDDALRFAFGASFSQTDPLLGRDIGFYVFRLPLAETVANVAFLLASLGLIAHAVLCLSLGVFRDWDQLDQEARRRAANALGWNLIVLALAAGAGYALERFRLLHASGGTVSGPGYTDAVVLMPALWVMAGVTLVVVAAALLAVRRATLRPLAVSVGGAVAAHVLLLGLLPGTIQKVLVDPSELARERPYLEHNIAFTRRAFAIDDVTERDYAAAPSLERADLADNRDTLRNVRLWDYRPLLRTFRQIQQIRLYYQFYDVDVDRYQLSDGYRQTMVSARELTPDLPERADTWVNRHLQYTHGYGPAMSLAAQEGGEGTPTLVVRDLPPVAERGAPMGDPAIYFGEHMADFRIVPSGIRELDYPAGDDNVYASYQGSGGVPVAGFWSRLLFAVHLFDVNILLTDYVTSDSRIQIRRPLQDRIEHVAPFLRLDRDPYVVTTDAGLYWIQDAYTTSDRYPYSESFDPFDITTGQAQTGRPPLSGAPFNYIRNSVKIVMDARSGHLGFHVMDPDDPVLAAYNAAFPGLFRPLSALPPGLEDHLRYPQDLFTAQVARYAAYHMQDPQVFYNNEDLWSVPQEKYGGAAIEMEPYFILMRLPGEERLEFMLMLPMTPRGRDNLIAWIAARSDFPGYGELVAFKLPKERLIYGPLQVEALIDQDTVISRQLSLWDQRGSRVIRGNLLVIPIDHSLIYVEPVYLVAEQNDIPQLKRVIAGHGERVAMAPTLELAIEALFGAPAAPAAPSEGAPPALGLVSEIRERIDAAEAALARGDWEGFGAAMEMLKQAVGEADEPPTDAGGG